MTPAGEYHDSDFALEEHAREARPLLEARLREREEEEVEEGGEAEERGQEEEGAQEEEEEEEEWEEEAEMQRPDYLAAWESFHSKDNSSSRF